MSNSSRNHPDDIHALFRDLLIGVTSIFRDSNAFDALQAEALPILLTDKKKGESFRVWIPAMLNREEAYFDCHPDS